MQAPPQRRQTAVGTRLIDYREARNRFGERPRVGRLFYLEGIKAGAQQKLELIAQDVAGGAQLAAEAEAFAQQARLAVGAAVAEFREHQRHQRNVIKPWRKFRDLAIVRPENANRSIALNKVARIGNETRARHDDRHAVRDRRVIE